MTLSNTGAKKHPKVVGIFVPYNYVVVWMPSGLIAAKVPGLPHGSRNECPVNKPQISRTIKVAKTSLLFTVFQIDEIPPPPWQLEK